MRRLLGGAVAAAASLLVLAGPAQAHDVLRSTDPADGSTIDVAPDVVVMTFDQPALAIGTELVVQAPGGRNVADGNAKLVDNTVQQAISGARPAGTYTVEWRVTSADGHPISGTFTFTTRTAVAGATGEPAPTSTPTPADQSAARDGGRSPASLVGLGVLVVLVVAGVLWAVRRPRRRT